MNCSTSTGSVLCGAIMVCVSSEKWPAPGGGAGVGRLLLLLRLVDAVEHGAVGEEALVRLAPALRRNRRHREQAEVGQFGRVLLADRLVRRPVVVPGDDLLRLVGVQEIE